MATEKRSAAAQLRARLDHPVIDLDGHWVEFGPQLNDYLKLVGGSKALEGFKSRPTEDGVMGWTQPSLFKTASIWARMVMSITKKSEGATVLKVK